MLAFVTVGTTSFDDLIKQISSDACLKVVLLSKNLPPLAFFLFSF